MQDIYLDKVKLHNFRSHIDSDMDFPLGCYQLFLGKNGAGKSSILNAISFALYDYSGDGLTIGDMVNRKAKKDLEIILDFRVVENNVTDNYKIELYYEHSKYRNKFVLSKNGVDISGKSKTDTYQIIENLLVPSQIYHNIYYFRQQVKDFFTSLSNGQQKQIFDAILSTQEYAVYYKNASDTIKLINESISKLDTQISITSTAIDIKKNQTLPGLTKAKETAKKEHEKKLFLLSEQKINYENLIQLLEDQLESCKYDSEKLNNIKIQLATEKEKLSELSKKTDQKLALVLSDHNNVLNSIKSNFDNIRLTKFSEIDKKLEEEKSLLNVEIQKIYATINEISQKYDTSALTNELQSFSDEKQKDIKFVDSEIRSLDTKFSTVALELERDTRIKIIESNIQEIRDAASKLKENESVLKTNIESLEKLIKQDLDSLNQDTSVCSKCLRPFTSESDASVIRDSVSKLQLEVTEFNRLLAILDSKKEPMKADYKSTVLLKSGAEADYASRIKVEKDKKKEQEDIYLNKKNLISSEISAFRSEIESKKKSLLEKKTSEVSLWETKKTKLNNDIVALGTEANKEKTIFSNANTKDMELKTYEQIKKYNEIVLSIKDKSYTETKELSDLVLKLESDRDTQIKERDGYENHQQILTSHKYSLQNVLVEQGNNSIFKFDDTQIVTVANEILEHEKTDFELLKNRSELVKEIKILEFWKDAYSDSGIKSMLIDASIPFLNESIAKALDVAAPGIFTVSFDTLKTNKSGDVKDKFNINILHNIKGTDSHKMLSGGEKRLIDLCCMEALRSLSEKLYGKRFHNIFYDEVLDSLDDDNCEAFSQASKIFAVDKNITLITHKMTEKIEPDRTFTF